MSTLSPRLRSVLGIARVSVLRFVRERSNIFFVFALPLLIILFIGMQFGGGSFSRVAIVGTDSPLGAAVDDAFARTDMEVEYHDGRAGALLVVEQRRVDAAIIVPAGDGLAEPVEVEFISSEPGTDAQAVLQSALGEYAIAVDAARLVAATTGGDPADHLDQVAAADATMAPISVSESVTGENLFSGVTQFNLGAATQVVLFTFLSSLTAASYLILTRRLGVARRMAASSTGIGTIVIGETLGKYAIALIQALYIVIATSVIFGVDWGNLVATSALIAVFCLVGTAGAILLGSVFNNEGAATGIGVALGISLGALGGAMMPSEFFSESVRRVSQFTPHYWALEGLKTVVWRDGDLGDVADELVILFAIAVVLLALATGIYRRTLLRA